MVIGGGISFRRDLCIRNRLLIGPTLLNKQAIHFGGGIPLSLVYTTQAVVKPVVKTGFTAG